MTGLGGMVTRVPSRIIEVLFDPNPRRYAPPWPFDRVTLVDVPVVIGFEGLERGCDFLDRVPETYLVPIGALVVW